MAAASGARATSAPTPPHNIEAEQGLLGAILINNGAIDRVAEFLKPEHFYEPIHGSIYEICRDLVLAGKAATPVTVKDFLTATSVVDLTIPQYLARLCAEATTIVNAYDYARTVYDLAVRRSIISIAEELLEDAFYASVDRGPGEQIEQAEQKLYALAETGRHGTGFQTFDAAASAAVTMAAAACQRDDHLSGLPTGLTKLDAMMGGLQPSDLIILAGRPGMGKTALATNIGYNIAKTFRTAPRPDGTHERVEGGIVGFFSMEMSAEQLATRIISEQTGIPSNRIRRGDVSDQEFERIRDHVLRRRAIPLHIDQTGGLGIAQIAARARRLKRQRGLHVLIIDYLQLMAGSGRRNDNRVTELTEITTKLKALAKELDVPIIALSQLNRGVENRDDKRPQLADLRESGSIEQDADVVLFVYREEYYHALRKPPESDKERLAIWASEHDKMLGKAEIIIGKQRHGPTGSVALHFDGAVTRFGNLDAPPLRRLSA